VLAAPAWATHAVGRSSATDLLIGMTFEQAVVGTAIAFFSVASLLLVRSVRQGRALSELLAARHPDGYEKLGRPWPGYFQSARRNRYFRLVMQREYLRIDDPPLMLRFENHRRFQIRFLVFLMVGFVTLGIAALWLRHAA
jgi:hypothetical protein